MSLNEEKILSGKFIFVSYSHKDADAVREDMTALLNRGVRVWYDHNMRIGDNWQEIAERVITHENCVGVLFYNSPNAFASLAVQKEQRLANERCESDGIKIWSVHLGGADTFSIVREVMKTVTDPEYMNAMLLQNKMFGDQILRIMRDGSAADRIYNEIAEPYHLVDSEDNFMDDAQRSNIASKGEEIITFGKYISTEYYGPERPTDNTDQRFGIGKNLIQLGETSYTTKDLAWKLMYVQDGRAVLLCTSMLDKMTYPDGEAFLADTFIKIAFTDNDPAGTEGVCARYMTLADVEECVKVGKGDSLKLAVEGETKHWWINENGLTDYWKETYSDNFRYERGFPIFVKKGIRPVLEIPVKNLSK